MIGSIITMEIALGTPKRMFPRRVNWERKACLECGHHLPWAEILDWNKRRRRSEPQHSPFCDSWLGWPVFFQCHSMDADEVPLRVFFMRSSLLIHLGMLTGQMVPATAKGSPCCWECTVTHMALAGPQENKERCPFLLWGAQLIAHALQSHRRRSWTPSPFSVLLDNAEPRPVAGSRKRDTAVASRAGRARSPTGAQSETPGSRWDALHTWNSQTEW